MVRGRARVGALERPRHSVGRLVSEPFMTVKRSADSRVVDETTAAEILESFRHHIENPALLMA